MPLPLVVSTLSLEHSDKLINHKEAEQSKKKEEDEDVVADLRRRSLDVRRWRQPPHRRCNSRPRRQRLGSEQQFPSGYGLFLYPVLILSIYIRFCCFFGSLLKSATFFLFSLSYWITKIQQFSCLVLVFWFMCSWRSSIHEFKALLGRKLVTFEMENFFVVEFCFMVFVLL